VAECDSTTVDVDLIFADTKNLHVRKRDDTEGLVDLESINSGLLNLGVLQGLGHSEGWCSGEFGRVLLSISPSKNLANWLQVVLLDGSLGRKDESSGAIGERRGVSRGDGSLLLECGADSACLSLVELKLVSTLVELFTERSLSLTFFGSSSLSTVMEGFPRPWGTSMGAISEVNLPASVAAIAFLYERMQYSS
jgi:hypothetical protein